MNILNMKISKRIILWVGIVLIFLGFAIGAGTVDSDVSDTLNETDSTTQQTETVTENYITGYEEIFDVAEDSICTEISENELTPIKNKSESNSESEESSISERKSSSLAHNYYNGQCYVCGVKDPNYVRDVTLWIPTNGGTKYHIYSGCSNMKNPVQVTKSEAVRQGFSPCRRCY